jgi:hypothetical protein
MRAGALIAVGLLMALTGCSTQPMRDLRDQLRDIFGVGNGDSALSLGLRQYDRGQYADSARSLQTAIDLG